MLGSEKSTFSIGKGLQSLIDVLLWLKLVVEYQLDGAILANHIGLTTLQESQQILLHPILLSHLGNKIGSRLLARCHQCHHIDLCFAKVKTSIQYCKGHNVHRQVPTSLPSSANSWKGRPKSLLNFMCDSTSSPLTPTTAMHCETGSESAASSGAININFHSGHYTRMHLLPLPS